MVSHFVRTLFSRRICLVIVCKQHVSHKPEVQNLSQGACIESWLQATSTGNLVKFWRLILGICWRTDIQTYRHVKHNSRCSTPMELTANWHSVISIPTCFLSTSRNISFSTIISWFCIVTLLRLCGLRIIVLLFSHTKNFDWHWHWLT